MGHLIVPPTSIPHSIRNCGYDNRGRLLHSFWWIRRLNDERRPQPRQDVVRHTGNVLQLLKISPKPEECADLIRQLDINSKQLLKHLPITAYGLNRFRVFVLNKHPLEISQGWD